MHTDVDIDFSDMDTEDVLEVLRRILEAARRDYLDYDLISSSEEKKECFTDAVVWLFNENDWGITSLHSICDYLNEDVNALRKKLMLLRALKEINLALGEDKCRRESMMMPLKRRSRSSVKATVKVR